MCQQECRRQARVQARRHQDPDEDLARSCQRCHERSASKIPKRDTATSLLLQQQAAAAAVVQVHHSAARPCPTRRPCSYATTPPPPHHHQPAAPANTPGLLQRFKQLLRQRSRRGLRRLQAGWGALGTAPDPQPLPGALQLANTRLGVAPHCVEWCACSVVPPQGWWSCAVMSCHKESYS
jgi:hypothetical protein